MASTTSPSFVPGVWGPYYSAMVPCLWLVEGGQSAAGAAIDQLLDFHPVVEEAREMAQRVNQPLPVWLADRILEKNGATIRCCRPGERATRGAGISRKSRPFADPHARAVICGSGMERDLDNLLALYIAGLCGIGYGLRQILDAQTAQGVVSKKISLLAAVPGSIHWYDKFWQIPAVFRSLPRNAANRFY
ncbi:FGGY-family carbohydrate kinase [Escherichia coli]